MTRLAIALLSLAVGCGHETALNVTEALLAVEASSVERFAVEATLPTDLRALPDGGWVVLDGYQGRALFYDSAGQLQGTQGSVEAWGQPLRMSPADGGGWWLSAPATELDAGAVVKVDERGAVQMALTAHPLPEGAREFSPIAVEQVGPWLVVSDRSGWVGRMNPEDGALAAVWRGASEDQRFGAVADLARGSGGDVWAVDARATRLDKLGVQGPLGQGFGPFGFWAGAMYRPKSAVVVGDAVVVADSALGVIQAFDADGELRGVIAQGDVPLRVEHPLAVRAAGEDALLILDASAPQVLRVTLAAGALAREPDPDLYHLRYPLLTQRADAPALPDEACVQCHDGFIQDDRVVWDAARASHPRELEHPESVPKAFSLTEKGQLACSSCHSPHGVVPEEAAADPHKGVVEGSRIHVGTDDETLGTGALCRACHGESPHEDALTKLGLGGGAHPSGAELAEAMKKRGPDALSQVVSQDCEACHSAHGAAEDPLLRDASSPALCTACHADQGQVGRNHPLVRGPGSDVEAPRLSAKLADAREGALGCRTCHDLVGGKGEGLVRQPADGGLLCLACHTERDDLMSAAHKGVRGQDGLVCLGCHDVHGASQDDHLLRIARAATAGDPQGCLSCHGKGGAVPGKAGHPVTGEAMASGDHLTCLSCHSAHDPMEKGARCESCHAEQAHAREAGGHGDATCLDCHPAHEAAPHASLAGVNPAAARCLACHATGSAGDAPEVASWEHPTPAFLPDGKRWQPDGRLPLFSASGEVQPATENGELLCQSCHVTHGPDASKGDNLRRDGWKEVCASCHGEDALVLYRYFHDPTRRASEGGSP